MLQPFGVVVGAGKSAIVSSERLQSVVSFVAEIVFPPAFADLVEVRLDGVTAEAAR